LSQIYTLSLHDALPILENGFRTPQPVAYIECFERGLLTNSYFVSEYTDFQPLKTIQSLPSYDQTTLLEDLATFTYRLHQSHIYHGDYSIRSEEHTSELQS